MIFIKNDTEALTEDNMDVENADNRIQVKDYQICWGPYQSSTGGGQLTTFPSPFTSTPYIIGSAPRHSTSWVSRCTHRVDETTTTCELQTINASANSRSGSNGDYVAVAQKV